MELLVIADSPQINDPGRHGSRREAIVRDILAGVFERNFKPGQRMKIEHLAEQYQVSATPIREALVELAGIGIVELAANRGAMLRPFGPRQLREICHVRSILECEAARCACQRMAPFELASLAENLQRVIASKRGKQWSEETRRLDSQLHELIAQRCGNERLAYEIGRYRVLYRTLRDVHHERQQARKDYTEMRENEEHLAIVEALAAGDAEAAASAMKYHLVTAAEQLEKDLFSAAELAEADEALFLTSPTAASNGKG